MAVTRLSDIINYEAWETISNEAVRLTSEKLTLLNSGALVRLPKFDQKLSTEEGNFYNERYWKDLDRTDSVVINDNPADIIPVENITMLADKQIRLNRAKAWGAMNIINQSINSPKPMDVIANLFSNYWLSEVQKIFISTVNGVFANNSGTISSPVGDEVQNDLTLDVSADADTAKRTFSSSNLLRAVNLLGDSKNDIGLIMCHSYIHLRMQELGLLQEFTNLETGLPFQGFLGMPVVINDLVPNPSGSASNGSQTASGVYHTWVFGKGSFLYGEGTPYLPLEIDRSPKTGNGSGQEELITRRSYVVHPGGYKYNLETEGPNNSNTAGNLAHGDTWKRVWTERKQVKLTRLITLEG